MNLVSKFFKFTIPSIVSMWIFSLYTMVDGIFIALGVGSHALGAVNLSMPFVSLIFTIGILLATGTKELPAFAGLGGARLYPRVLPTHEALDACAAAGIPARNIIAMQGPFTQALNEALLHQYGACWFVTKDGGAPGGFAEKAAAARAAGAQLVVIRRPEVKVDGVSYEQALEACRKAVQRCRTDPGSP